MAIRIDPADEAFSDYIRTRDGWECQRCLELGKRSVFRPPDRLIRLFPQFEDRTRNAMGLHAMHCFGRRGRATRFDEDNTAAGCYGCHSYLDEHPHEKYVFFENRLGSARFEELRARAYQKIVRGLDLEAVKKEYRDRLRKLCSA